MIRRLAACALLTVFLSSCGQAAPAQNTPSVGSGSTLLPASLEITNWTLSNGMQIHYLHNQKPAGRVELRVVVHAGSANEMPGQEGLAHYIEHMAFNGTASFKAGDVLRVLQELGSSFGSDINAFTTFDATVYHLEVDTKPETLDTSMHILSEFVAKPLYLPEEIQKERGVILAEKREGEGPYRKLWDQEIAKLFGDTSYAKDIIGTETTIKSFTQADFQKFWKQWYRPDNMELVLVGDIQKEALEPYIQKYFASIPKATDPLLPEPISPQNAHIDLPNSTWLETVDADIAEPSVHLEWRLPAQNIETEQGLRSQLAEQLVVTMLNRRLQEMADKHSDIISSVYASIDARTNVFNHVVEVSATFRQEKYEAGVPLLRQELERFVKDGVHDEELAFTAAGLEGQFRDMLTNADSKISASEAGNIEDSIIYHDKIWTIDAQMEAQIAMLKKFTAENIHKDIQLLDPRQAFGFVLRTPKMPENMVTQGAALFAQELQEPHEAYVFIKPTLTVEDFPNVTPSLPTSFPLLELQKVDLPNGITLMSRHTNFDKDRLLLRVIIQGGPLSYLDDMRGIQAFQHLLNYVSIQNLTHQDLVNLLQEKQIKMMVAPQNGETALFFDAPTAHMDEVLQLAHDLVTAPHYGEAELKKVQEELASIAENIAADPGAQMSEVMGKLLWGDSNISDLWTAKERNDLNLTRLRKVQEDLLRSSHMEVLIMGSASEEDMQQKAAKVFGAIAAQPAHAFDTQRSAHPFPAATSQKITLGAIPRASISMRFPGTTYADIHSIAVYTLLGEIMSNKVFESLREDASAMYSPQATFYVDPDRQQAYLMVDFETEPARAQEMIDLYWKTIDKIDKEGINAGDLLRVRLPLLTSMTVGKATNDYWFYSAGSKFFMAPVDFLEQMLSEIPKVTTAELTQALQTSVQKSKTIQLIRYPAEQK